MLFAIIFGSFSPIYAQHKIGITSSLLSHSEIFIRNTDVVGAAQQDAKGKFSVGIAYLLQLNKWLELEADLEYTKMEVKTTSHYPLMRKTYLSDMEFIDIPVGLRANFLQYFFANIGTFLEFDISDKEIVDEQTGMGIVGGVGAKYDFKSGISIFANYYIKYHGVVIFNPSQFQQRVGETGFKFGVTYAIFR